MPAEWTGSHNNTYISPIDRSAICIHNDLCSGLLFVSCRIWSKPTPMWYLWKIYLTMVTFSSTSEARRIHPTVIDIGVDWIGVWVVEWCPLDILKQNTKPIVNLTFTSGWQNTFMCHRFKYLHLVRQPTCVDCFEITEGFNHFIVFLYKHLPFK